MHHFSNEVTILRIVLSYFTPTSNNRFFLPQSPGVPPYWYLFLLWEGGQRESVVVKNFTFVETGEKLYLSSDFSPTNFIWSRSVRICSILWHYFRVIKMKTWTFQKLYQIIGKSSLTFFTKVKILRLMRGYYEVETRTPIHILVKK